MRVLICHQPTDGGVGRHVTDLIEGLTHAGHEITVCSPALPAGLSASVQHVSLDLRRAVAPRADAVALARFARVVRAVRPDVIHAHSSKAGAVARLARVLAPRTPVIYTPHGYAFAGYFSSAKERLAYKLIERVLSPLASRVSCVCEAEARLARSVGPRRRVRVVHNGIPLPGPGGVDARLEQLKRLGPVLGALTQLRPGKGLETLLDATPLLLARHPGAQLAIVGDGPDLEGLQARAGELGVAASVHFLGPSSEPLSALRGMDVFVHPSWAEAFPYVILEAMALERPIVASDVGGIGEAVERGHSGLLTPPREPQPLADALIEMLDDPARAAQLGASALQRMAQFTREAMIERVSGVYSETAGARGARTIVQREARSARSR
jgi:glycosyltransferase involved in cell wall biosynthesis